MVTVKPGEAFDIELGSAPGTGYVWHLAALPAGVVLAGSDFAQAAEAAVGDPGVQRFRLRAESTGQFELRFELKRRWEALVLEERIVLVDSR